MSRDASDTAASRKAVQAMLDAAIARDMSRFWDCFDENVVVYEPSYLPYGGIYRGMTQFKELFPALLKYMDVTTLKLESMIADGDQVACRWHVETAQHDSEAIMTEWYTVRDGKIAELRIFFNELGSLTHVLKL